MRRNDKEIHDIREIEEIIERARVCRIGLADRDGPYVVPVCFGYRDRTFFIHSSPEGKKMSIIRNNPPCCIEIDEWGDIMKKDSPCAWGMEYRSVIAMGMARILTDPEEKRAGLQCILHHYGSGAYNFSNEAVRNVAVIQVATESITGKRSARG